jgi:hypothetical protein
MKKWGLIFCLAGVVFLSSVFSNRTCFAGVDVNIGISVPLPMFAFSSPPVLVVVPQTYVYAVPDVSVDIFFFRGYWYRPHNGYWYRSAVYNGPWDHMGSGKVPAELLRLPDHRNIPPGHQRIPYGQVKKNWKDWEKVKHWDKSERKSNKNQHRGEKRRQGG